MFKSCLVCNRPFPANEELEHFPSSTRVAFDPVRGRLWAVCLGCKRWSLAPIESRWEALDELEKGLSDLYDESVAQEIGNFLTAEQLLAPTAHQPIGPTVQIFSRWAAAG